MIFKDRHEAGVRLAESLKRFSSESTVVFAIPPGGVVPASIVANALHAPLNLIVVRRVTHAGNGEAPVAVVSEYGRVVTNPTPVHPVDAGWLGLAVREQEQEARRLRRVYGEDTAPVQGRTAIIVDDGMLTGLAMSLAIEEVRRMEPQRVVVAVPAATAAAIEKVRYLADETITIVEMPDAAASVSSCYARFKPVSDQVVTKAMRSSHETTERQVS